MRISDGKCERHIFDKNLKSWMNSDGEGHDGMRRCSRRADWYDPIKNEFLCTFHFNQAVKIRHWNSEQE